MERYNMNNSVIIELIKMSFIFNMINDGWRFRFLEDNTMEFKKIRKYNENINLSNLIRKHLC